MSATGSQQAPISPKVADFTLAEGGLAATMMRRIGLADRVVARGLLFPAIAWLPLLILSMAGGLAWGDAVRIPFLMDYGVYGRLLIGLPVLVFAEVPIGRRTRDVLREFTTSNIVVETDFIRFNDAVHDATRRKESIWPEVVILALIYGSIIFRAQTVLSDPLTTWYRTEGGTTAAAVYYAFISLPIFQFLLLRWAWRLLVWTALLRRISRLNLQLLPIHPDSMGGLGFLGLAQIAFCFIVFAGGAIVSSYLANQMIYHGMSLGECSTPIAVYVLLATLVTLAPVLVFSPKLIRLRASGILAYSDVGAEYTRLFDRKWAKGINPEGEAILGTSDIQSLADLRNSFAVIQGMSIIAADRLTLKVTVAAAALPMVPLLFIALPFQEIIAGVLGLQIK